MGHGLFEGGRRTVNRDQRTEGAVASFARASCRSETAAIWRELGTAEMPLERLCAGATPAHPGLSSVHTIGMGQVPSSVGRHTKARATPQRSVGFGSGVLIERQRTRRVNDRFATWRASYTIRQPLAAFGDARL
jgi:hypothetical protein